MTYVKKPLVIAAAIIVIRIVLEQVGAPSGVNIVFGVVWLYLILPFWFAGKIAASPEPRPYLALFKNVGLFALLSRVLVMVTYWLAYAFSWTPTRFSLAGGGVVGEGVTPLQGYLVIPLRNLAAWTVAATLIGMILGGITLAVMRRRAVASSAT